MATKVTLQLPDQVVERLRKCSKAEGLSLDETALRALLRGLGDPDADAWWWSLGDLLEEPPTRRYDPEEIERLRVELAPGAARGLMEELDWVRGGPE